MKMATVNIDSTSSGVSAKPAVLVMGMGATGASCARYFAARGELAEFVDSRSQPPGMSAILDVMPDARIHTGQQHIELSPQIRRIIVSPGFDLALDIFAQARERGIEILSDIDLFVAECTCPLIAITGSNGKSTVTAMLGETLNATGQTTLIGGNIGTPALDLLGQNADLVVLELSSFQLERSQAVPAAAAVILNLSPDHLDQHGSMESYRTAKARIYASCQHAVVNRDAPELGELVPRGTRVTSFGLDSPAPGQLGVRRTPRGECIACGEELLLSVDEFPLIGRHNLANALAVLALGAALGMNLSGMAQAMKRFRGLDHRMQIVANHGDITWVNDSKATNVDAALASLNGVADPVVLIAGGDAKGAAFDELAQAIAGREIAVILLGKDAGRMAEALAGSGQVRIVKDMPAAVAAAQEIAAPGHTVLLAPACSSLDMFRDFAARGDAFRAAVLELAR